MEFDLLISSRIQFQLVTVVILQTSYGAHPARIQWIPGDLPRVEIKNEWSHTYPPPTRLQVVCIGTTLP